MTTRKRARKQSQALDQKDFFVPGFNDTPETEKVWEEMLHIMEKEGGGAPADGEPMKGKPKKKQKQSAIIETSNEGNRNVVNSCSIGNP